MQYVSKRTYTVGAMDEAYDFVIESKLALYIENYWLNDYWSWDLFFADKNYIK